MDLLPGSQFVVNGSWFGIKTLGSWYSVFGGSLTWFTNKALANDLCSFEELATTCSTKRGNINLGSCVYFIATTNFKSKT